MTKTIEKLSIDLQKLKIKKRKNIYLELPCKERSGLVVSINSGLLILPSGIELLSEIDLKVHHDDRIAILGNNGSGKTTLVKQLIYCTHPLLQGEIKYGAKYNTLFVDQKYDLIKPEMSIYQNLHENNQVLSNENVHRVLSNLGFSKDHDIEERAKTLSGGETARLAFAIATSSNIDMLILDEPTNNLDTETVQVISDALQGFRGTLIVISHDMHFLRSIGIQRYYTIEEKKLNLLGEQNV